MKTFRTQGTCSRAINYEISDGIVTACEFVTGIWPPEFERILNGESASMLAQDARLGKL